MSRWLDIAAQADPASISAPDTQQEPSKRPEKGQGGGAGETEPPLMMVYEVCRDDKSIDGSASQSSDMRHGFAINGHPKTWNGNIISLQQWRQLTEWEKHGPNGRHWNGKTKYWEYPNDT
ncbi:hypothetical protein C1J03_03110 [Sulfitobacter sp. SK012]|uniref:hypothetical protein n=1 Tax=Sulfitobacter sp. SK012 TaxID=1389005 RepID=UPI000E0A3D59|nr:hypothetical protein [Sulfitobacter sp. SK012]AXI45112.1 hypothetical protein C1J03_03110 [Sulfitobacter sp. SK012]